MSLDSIGSGARPRPKIGKLLLSDRVLFMLSPLVVLSLWEACARLGIADVRFFPAPTNILYVMGSMILSGELLLNLKVSLIRVLMGMAVGGIPALAIGLAMGLYRPLRAAFDPLISATYPIPKSTLLPLFLLIFGLGESSKVAMVAVGVFYPIAINTAVGVRQIPSIYLDVGSNYCASRWNVFRTIALPGAMPFIMTGIKLGAGMGLVLVAIAEMVGAKSGLGYMTWNAWELFDVPTMYAGLFTFALVSVFMNVTLDVLERVVMPWKSA